MTILSEHLFRNFIILSNYFPSNYGRFCVIMTNQKILEYYFFLVLYEPYSKIVVRLVLDIWFIRTRVNINTLRVYHLGPLTIIISSTCLNSACEASLITPFCECFRSPFDFFTLRYTRGDQSSRCERGGLNSFSSC